MAQLIDVNTIKSCTFIYPGAANQFNVFETVFLELINDEF